MPILTHFILDTPITMETDALDYAVASTLSITCADGELRLVAFYSWTLTAPELNYDIHNKELLAIFEVLGILKVKESVTENSKQKENQDKV